MTSTITTSAILTSTMTSLPPTHVTDPTMTALPTTAALPSPINSTVIGVVIAIVLLTLGVLAFLLYRYLCHNKGDYRTTGELPPGEDKDHSSQAADEKKEYFI